MSGSDFDRIATLFARRLPRRSLAGLAAGIAVVRAHSPAGAQLKQLTPSTCSASGEVCTHLRGCCDALTCVTSAINTNYGVCVPGDGGTVSVGTTLISPFSEEVETEIAALAQGATTTDTTSTTTTDLEAEREQRIADKKLRKENRRDDQKLRKQTQQNEQQDRREDRKDNLELRRGPNVRLQLFKQIQDDDPEIVKVTNRDDETIVLNRIESLLHPDESSDLTPPLQLSVGESFLFVSASSANSTDNRLVWHPTPICDGVPGAGFVVVAARSANVENHEFLVRCDAANQNGNENPDRRKRRKKSNRGRDRGKSGKKNG